MRVGGFTNSPVVPTACVTVFTDPPVGTGVGSCIVKYYLSSFCICFSSSVGVIAIS